MNLVDKIREIEGDLGGLSAQQKLLLTTDGSITNTLEILIGGEVGIETLHQKIVEADEKIAEKLGVANEDEINERIVRIYNKKNNKPLIYAISYAPLRRADKDFSEDLFSADIPIGKIMEKYKIESRREIKDIDYTRANEELSKIFGVFEEEILLRRNYSIIRKGEILIDIYEIFPYSSFQNEFKVIIETPSRLHLTLIDLNGEGGRIDGGVGITLDDPRFLIEAKIADVTNVSGYDQVPDEEKDHIVRAANMMLNHLGIRTGVEFRVRNDYPMHVGLGSGTQMSIAAGKAVSELFGRKFSTREIARIVGRGGTSGIGTAAFEGGGFILDAGHSFGEVGEKKDYMPSSASNASPPPLIVRYDFPEDWKIVLAIPDIKGSHGDREIDIFQRFCPIDTKDVRELSHLILLKMIPSLLEKDIESFGEAVNRIQRTGFKKVEVGLQPAFINELMESMLDLGAYGVGLSSFGPTVYGIIDNKNREIKEGVGRLLGNKNVVVTKARNFGAKVRTF
ncbi:MAG: Beta-ribofuranosylaminobenzene 5'-phosphate synthase [Candidatus Methanolliviera sp. GoM_oil]|nr:MAG: Beta-ribofuranosylaminobenzene 5'-phosphate synthase [Candidatus Methanolliviera sp. GoM_oil]